jgi:branched-chain amino acid transport system ATP-binding protein
MLWLDGEDITGLGPHDLVERGLCHIPEGRGIFPSLSVRENLRLFARRAGLDDEGHRRAAEALPILERRADQPAGTLSGGEQQMLALARAYLTQPRYVLLDEVSMGLAPRMVDEIFEFLAHLVDLGCALLLVEQYIERALAIADVAYVLRKGQVAFAGQPAELDTARLAAEYLGDSAADHAAARG